MDRDVRSGCQRCTADQRGDRGWLGNSGPDLSIEVDDVAAVHQRMQTAGFTIEYGPVTEPWGVTRFYVRDPFGRLVNILEHR